MKAAANEPQAKPASRPTHALGLVAEFEGNAAQNQARQHEQKRQIEGGKQRRIDNRKCAPENDASHHQPGFVAVPDRSHGRHHPAPARSLRVGPKRIPTPRSKPSSST
jgi:hypothetical protein